MKIQFSVTLDVSHRDWVPEFELILDVVYNGWRDGTEYGDMESITVVYPEPQTEG